MSFLPFLFLALLTLVCNLYERSSGSLGFEEKVYSFKQVEDFVSSVSPYTFLVEEEPVLAASALAFDSDVIDGDFLEKPLILETVSKPADISTTPQRKEVITYQVVASDTLSKIAKKFGISIKTIASANNLSSVDKIKPGQSLLIPPANGVIHIVARGETLSALTKKYQGDLKATLEYNSETIKIGQKVLIVGGKEPTVAPPTTRVARSRNVVTRESSSSGSKRLGGGGSRSNGYSWGWCTWYAAYRRNVPRNWGNAGQWLYSARRSGYATGKGPAAGAIIVTRESWWGHVGYVESVRGNSVVISEMNYNGWGVINRRSIPRNSSVIKGYIY